MTEGEQEAARTDVESGIYLVPQHLRRGLRRHVLDGTPVGHFLTACLENDLRAAVGRADDDSFAGLRRILTFLHNCAPSACWGSPEKVEAWRARGGLSGKELAGD